MRNRMDRLGARLAAALALIALAACSGGGGSNGQSGAAGASPQPTNSLNFPLFDGAQVLSTNDFKQNVSTSAANSNALLAQGAGTYVGRDVVAGTQAAMPALETWLGNLDSKPPQGWSVEANTSGMESMHDRARAVGVDFAVFSGAQDGKTHHVVVVAVDPQTLDSKAGGVLSMVGKYKMIPQSLRDPIDAQAKKQMGYSISDMMQPDTPIGAVVTAFSELKDYGGRGVILIDASKQ